MSYLKYLKYKLKYQKLKNIELSGGSRNLKKKYAIVTLLMINDNYLPGCLTLAQSIKRFKKSKKIDLICMVTPDISNSAINELKKFYDRVIPINYIEIDRNRIRHSQDKVKDIYAKTFSKINCLKFTEYKKILMMDVDMLVIKEDFFKIFKVKAPAAPFIGCLVFYKKDIIDIYKKVYSELKHGKLVPKKYYDINCDKLYKEYNIKTLAHIGIESTIFLVEPSIEDYNNMIKIISEGNKLYKGDATLLADYYEYKFHHIDTNFVGRWENPDENSEIIVMDLYGFNGKPWDIEHNDEMIKYIDARYWMKKYIEYYEKYFKDVFEKQELIKLYNFLKKKLS